MKGQGLVLAAGSRNDKRFGPIGTEESPVIVDLHAHRGEIQAVLIQRTPLGSSVKSVLDFISKQLQQDKGMSPVGQLSLSKTVRTHVP